MIMIICCIVSVITAYLLGSIATAVFVGKWFYGVDVRTMGSHNAGTTNVIRVLGTKPGVIVFVIDVLKGAASVLMMNLYCRLFDVVLPDFLPVVVVAATVLGHIYPVFAGFKGGKGVATLLGVGLALFPAATLSAFAVFIVALCLSHYVSVGSMLAGLSFPLWVFFVFPEQNVYLQLLAICVAVFMPVVHIKNIQRLIKKEENKFYFKK